MGEQVQKSKAPAKQEEEVTTDVEVDEKQDLKDRMDDLLDEIDEVLEENASDFVRQYVQKGGE